MIIRKTGDQIQKPSDTNRSNNVTCVPKSQSSEWEGQEVLAGPPALSFTWDTLRNRWPLPQVQGGRQTLSYSQLRTGFLFVQEEGSFPAMDGGRNRGHVS